MKISVSLPPEDVEFLDQYARAHDLPTRSAAVHGAVATLRALALGDAYEEAWAEWELGEDSGLWENTLGDGV